PQDRGLILRLLELACVTEYRDPECRLCLVEVDACCVLDQRAQCGERFAGPGSEISRSTEGIGLLSNGHDAIQGVLQSELIEYAHDHRSVQASTRRQSAFARRPGSRPGGRDRRRETLRPPVALAWRGPLRPPARQIRLSVRLALAGDTMLGRVVAKKLGRRPPESLVDPELAE